MVTRHGRVFPRRYAAMTSTDRSIDAATPMRVLHRFEKSDGHWAEIRERIVPQLRVLEVLVFVDGSLLMSHLFQGGREAEYPGTIESRVREFTDGGWTQLPAAFGS